MSGDLLQTAAELGALSFGTSITPGPNNLMLLNSGLHFGLRRTLRHCAGVSAGLAAALLAAYFGLGAAVAHSAGLLALLSLICALYLLWMAARMLEAPLGAPSATSEVRRPMSFAAAFGFQFINPKVWAMAAAGVSLVLASSLQAGHRPLLLIGIFTTLNLPCITLWAAAGAQLQRGLASPVRQTLFR